MKVNWREFPLWITFLALIIFMIDLILTGGFWE